MIRFHAPRTAAAILVAGIAACSNTMQGPVAGSPSPVTADQSEVRAIEKARADSARYPYTKADVDFMSGMIGHHAQAIQMSSWAPTHGASPSIRVLAERIINAQQDEIASMQRWLTDRRQPVPEVNPKGMKMKMDGMEHVMLMPGMLTEEQMHRLDQARGPEFDRLFLTSMIQHHRGAVSMVQALFASYGAGQDETVFKFASDVNIDQTTEITRMEKMLTALVTTVTTPH